VSNPVEDITKGAGMNIGDLRQFLRAANLHGYAAGRAARQRRESDGSTTIEYQSGDWRFNDNYFGGEPYGGRSVVFQREQPIWMAVYYGWVEASDDRVQPAYAFLQRALLLAPTEFPVRGPAEFTADGFTYRSKYQGGLVQFRGEERIEEAGQCAYRAWFCGGLIDRRRGE
jgi:hypothetical protein